MQNKTIFVTGANSGIGKETTRALARQGGKVVMICRNPEKGEAAKQEILASVPDAQLDLQIGDLSSMSDVRRLAGELQTAYPKIDVLINNAGLMLPDRQLTADGYEYTFALNHLGHFLLTHLLMPQIQKSPAARIVHVASDAHRQGSINFEDLMGEQKYSSLKAYAQSKLANILFSNELSRRLEGSPHTSNSLHPGVVKTGFGRQLTGGWKIMLKLLSPMMTTPEKGAQTSVYLASSPEAQGKTGVYWVKSKPKSTIPEAVDEGVAKRLWEVSEKLVGI